MKKDSMYWINTLIGIIFFIPWLIWMVFFRPPSNKPQYVLGWFRLAFWITAIFALTGHLFDHSYKEDVNMFFVSLVGNGIMYHTLNFVFGIMTLIGVVLALIVSFGFYNNTPPSIYASDQADSYSDFAFPNIANMLSLRDAQFGQISNKERIKLLRNTGFVTKGTFSRENMTEREREAFSLLNSQLGQMTNSEIIDYMSKPK